MRIAQPFPFIHEMTLNIEQNRNRVQTKLQHVLINDLKCNIWRIITLSQLYKIQKAIGLCSL
jgi:hypothetical protein